MDEIISAIRALLAADGTIAALYKKIYYGVNPIPADSELPCIEVYPIGTQMLNLGTASMMNTYTIGVRIKDTLKAFVTNDTNKQVIDHSQDFVQRVENRDSNGKPDSGTILRVLHDNRQLSNTASIHEVSGIKYNTRELDKVSMIITAEINVTVKKISPR